MENFGDILRQLGPAKNTLLGSAFGFAIALLGFCDHMLLTQPTVPIYIIAGALAFFAVAIFSTVLGFYIFAILKLPSSAQELFFLQGASATFAEHERKSSKINGKKATRHD
jgi:hypothetical protein